MAHGQKGWVRQLFVAHDAAAGVYSVRFFHWGRWEYVIVDDIIGYHDHDVGPAEPAVDAPLQVILPTAPGVSNEGRSSPLLVILQAVSWPWDPAWGSLEPSRRGEAVKTRRKNGKFRGENGRDMDSEV